MHLSPLMPVPQVRTGFSNATLMASLIFGSNTDKKPCWHQTCQYKISCKSMCNDILVLVKYSLATACFDLRPAVVIRREPPHLSPPAGVGVGQSAFARQERALADQEHFLIGAASCPCQPPRRAQHSEQLQAIRLRQFPDAKGKTVHPGRRHKRAEQAVPDRQHGARLRQ